MLSETVILNKNRSNWLLHCGLITTIFVKTLERQLIADQCQIGQQ